MIASERPRVWASAAELCCLYCDYSIHFREYTQTYYMNIKSSIEQTSNISIGSRLPIIGIAEVDRN